MKYGFIMSFRELIFKEDGARYFLSDKSGLIKVFYETVAIM